VNQVHSGRVGENNDPSGRRLGALPSGLLNIKRRMMNVQHRPWLLAWCLFLAPNFGCKNMGDPQTSDHVGVDGLGIDAGETWSSNGKAELSRKSHDMSQDPSSQSG